MHIPHLHLVKSNYPYKNSTGTTCRCTVCILLYVGGCFFLLLFLNQTQHKVVYFYVVIVFYFFDMVDSGEPFFLLDKAK